MKLHIWSKTKIGKWANSLTLIFILLIVLKILNFQRISLPLQTPTIAVFAIVGFVMALTSSIKDKDRALLTIVSILVGLLIAIWLAAEIALSY
jgi:NAD/NADP transhydrogenase beta subunit